MEALHLCKDSINVKGSKWNANKRTCCRQCTKYTLYFKTQAKAAVPSVAGHGQTYWHFNCKDVSMWTRTHLIIIRACAGDPGPDSTHGFIKMTVLSCWWSSPANKGWRDPRVSESPVQNQLALFLDLSLLCLLLREYWCVYVWVCDGLNPITNSFYGGNFLQGDSIRPLYIEAKCTDVTVEEISNSAHTHT